MASSAKRRQTPASLTYGARYPFSTSLQLTGDVLPAIQLATHHAHETGWQAVRLSRPNMTPWTAVRLPARPSWQGIVVFSRVSKGHSAYRSVKVDDLILVRRGSQSSFTPSADLPS
jgi:hypothetical protein